MWSWFSALVLHLPSHFLLIHVKFTYFTHDSPTFLFVYIGFRDWLVTDRVGSELYVTSNAPGGLEDTYILFALSRLSVMFSEGLSECLTNVSVSNKEMY